MKLLITGGAGFVGSSLAFAFKDEHPQSSIVVMDNLHRRGSEINLSKFKNQGIRFAHGDIRNPQDFWDLDEAFDLIIDASAEPSVLSGLSGSPHYVLGTNLVGTLNCLEFARQRKSSLIFLSSSRVYSIAPLKGIQLTEAKTRFEIASQQKSQGVSKKGIDETFPTHLARSFYGATKLASEQIIQEYVETYNLKAWINRCGVLAGPGQFGKTDQGVFTLWVAHHIFNQPLKYTGFGGAGKQVRDLLHPLDLYELIRKQISMLDQAQGQVFNIGGGDQNSVSMLEMTHLCEEVVGRSLSIQSSLETSPVDIPLYISNNRLANHQFNWNPSRSVKTIVKEVADWIYQNEHTLKPIFT